MYVVTVPVSEMLRQVAAILNTIDTKREREREEEWIAEMQTNVYS
jgi:hypothetical protein